MDLWTTSAGRDIDMRPKAATPLSPMISYIMGEAGLARRKAAALALGFLRVPRAGLRVPPPSVAETSVEEGAWLGFLILPSRTALACLTLLTPQALQRVFGPRGPSRHWGVLVTPH